MKDFVVTAICSKCNHVWTFPNVFEHNCPTCGTSAPPVDVDVLAGRRERAAKGDQLDPIVMVPDKDTTLMQQFTQGVAELRKVITEHEAEAQMLTDWANDFDANAGNDTGITPQERESIKALYYRASAARSLASRLRAAERKVSAIFILGDQAEKFIRTDPGARARRRERNNDPCPDETCDGTLASAFGGPLFCDTCGKDALGDRQTEDDRTGSAAESVREEIERQDITVISAKLPFRPPDTARLNPDGSITAIAGGEWQDFGQPQEGDDA